MALKHLRHLFGSIQNENKIVVESGVVGDIQKYAFMLKGRVSQAVLTYHKGPILKLTPTTGQDILLETIYLNLHEIESLLQSLQKLDQFLNTDDSCNCSGVLFTDVIVTPLDPFANNQQQQHQQQTSDDKKIKLKCM